MSGDVKLDNAGVFSACGGKGTIHLFYDGADKAGRWIVAAARSGRAPRPVSKHVDLDEGLRALVRTAGMETERFTVDLPCGERFSRPGRVDATSVLSAMDYVVTRGITTYVVVRHRLGASDDEVSNELNERLSGRAVGVGTVDSLEDDGEYSVWCCDITLPFEGPLRRPEARELIEREMQGTGLALSSCHEILPASPVLTHTAAVLEFRAIKRAA